MKPRRSVWLWGSIGAMPLALAIGWWLADRESEFVAHARIAVPDAAVPQEPGPRMLPTIEETLLSPEAITGAADRLRRQGIPLPVSSPLDSEVEYLMNRLDARRERHGDHDEFEITYLTPDPATAVDVLKAVLETGLEVLRQLSPEAEDPGDDRRDRELERVSQSLQREQQTVSSLDERIAEADLGESRESMTAEGMRSLVTALDESRTKRAEAEDRLADARAQLRSGASAAQVIAGLPEGVMGASVRDLAGAEETRTLLRRKVAALKEISRVYGRNHPRIVALRSEIDELRTRLATILVSPSKPPNPLAEQRIPALELVEEELPTVATVLLEILDEQQLKASALEQDLERRLFAASDAKNNRSKLESQRDNGRQTLHVLQEEHDRIAREIADARRQAERRRASVIEAPALFPDPIVPSPAPHLFWAGVAGLAVAVLCWRKHRQTRVLPEEAVATLPLDRERARKQADDQARLRRLRRAA